jgi:hypothetical protein
MLAILERLITDAGGSYAFCDTDSMAIVATHTGGTIPCLGGSAATAAREPAVKALSWEQVEDIREKFTQLNPYTTAEAAGSLLELESENYTDEKKTTVDSSGATRSAPSATPSTPGLTKPPCSLSES